MPKYISNYVILPDSTVLHNHIVDVDDSGRLSSISPFSSELAYTQYVAHPVLVIDRADIDIISSLFKRNRNLTDFCREMREELDTCKKLTNVALFELNFTDGYLSRLL